jgi:hypothetical protein
MFISLVGFKVLTAVVMKSSVLWDIKLCSPLKVYQRFKGTCHLSLQGRRISQARNQHEAGSKQGEALLTFNGLHSVISQKTELFISLVHKETGI